MEVIRRIIFLWVFISQGFQEGSCQFFSPTFSNFQPYIQQQPVNYYANNYQPGPDYQQFYQQPINQHQQSQMQGSYQPCQHYTPFGFPFGYTNPCPTFNNGINYGQHLQPSTVIEPFTQLPQSTTESFLEESTTHRSLNKREFLPGEISALKCEEYKKMSYEVSHFGGLTVKTILSEHKASKCDLAAGLIVGGVKANPGELPHMGAIAYPTGRRNFVFGCGASLISERFLLTAAHCQYHGSVKAKFVRLGVINVNSRESEDYMIEKFIRHENFVHSTRENDIAVIKLSRSVSLRNSQNVRPACLWQNENIPQAEVVASGWGQTTNNHRSISSDLMKVKLSLLDLSYCLRSYEDSGIKLSQSNLCAGNMEGGRDTCQGDSGGPIQIVLDDHMCVSHVVGVTSFGATVCAQKDSPSVYTRVSAFIDWIETHVWKDLE